MTVFSDCSDHKAVILLQGTSQLRFYVYVHTFSTEYKSENPQIVL